MIIKENFHKSISTALLIMLGISLAMALFVFITPQSVFAATPEETPPPQTDSIPLGCVCEHINLNLWRCCYDAYWHPGSPGWLECQGGWYWLWWLPNGCDPWN